MKRYFLHLAYNGKEYSGWQVQPNAITVQEVVEKMLSLVLRNPVAIVGAGRTDAGVHARSMYAHFDTEDVENLVELTEKLNRMLPKDIVIYDIYEVNPDAHARFDALSRLYRYYITTVKDPYLYPFKYKIHGSLDIGAMNACADILFDYSDFTSFSKLHTDTKTNNCKVMLANWEQVGNDYIFTIKADRFLRNMVRSIVGTLLDVGKGKLNETEFRKIIEAKDRCSAGTSVPGHALFLEEIDYPQNIFLKNEN